MVLKIGTGEALFLLASFALFCASLKLNSDFSKINMKKSCRHLQVQNNQPLEIEVPNDYPNQESPERIKRWENPNGLELFEQIIKESK